MIYSPEIENTSWGSKALPVDQYFNPHLWSWAVWAQIGLSNHNIKKLLLTCQLQGVKPQQPLYLLVLLYCCCFFMGHPWSNFKLYPLFYCLFCWLANLALACCASNVASRLPILDLSCKVILRDSQEKLCYVSFQAH